MGCYREVPDKDDVEKPTYCINCVHCAKEHSPELWKCKKPTGKIDPVTGGVGVGDQYCNRKNTIAECADYDGIDKLAPVLVLTRWQKFKKIWL